MTPPMLYIYPDTDDPPQVLETSGKSDLSLLTPPALTDHSNTQHCCSNNMDTLKYNINTHDLYH